MKQLSEFTTLQEARDYSFAQGKMIHRNSMNAWLSAAGKTYTLTVGTSDTDVIVSTTNYISGETSSVNSFVVTFAA